LRENVGNKMMNENADNKARAIDAIIAEESSKNSFYP
jgi:hypothetical protein